MAEIRARDRFPVRMRGFPAFRFILEEVPFVGFLHEEFSRGIHFHPFFHPAVAF